MKANDHHYFANASEIQEMTMEVCLNNPEDKVREEHFFRNLFPHYDDLRKEGRDPSKIQLAAICWDSEIIIAPPGSFPFSSFSITTVRC